LLRLECRPGLAAAAPGDARPALLRHRPADRRHLSRAAGRLGAAAILGRIAANPPPSRREKMRSPAVLAASRSLRRTADPIGSSPAPGRAAIRHFGAIAHRALPPRGGSRKGALHMPPVAQAGRRVRGRSSAGRASQWHCEGQGFDPPRLHHLQSPETEYLSRYRLTRADESDVTLVSRWYRT